MEKLQGLLNPYRREDREVLRKLTEGNVIELDSNDRLLVPAEQKHVIAKAKEIVLQSTGKFIELWGRDSYEKMNQSSRDFAEKAEALLGRVLPPSDKMPVKNEQ